MSFYGADVTALRSLAHTFLDRATALDAITATLRAAVTTTPWSGPDADALRARWDGEMEAALRSASGLLADGAQTLRAQAEQQDAASTSDGAASGSGGAGGGAGLPALPDLSGLFGPAPATPSGEPPTIVATETATMEAEASIGPFEAGHDVEYRIDELSDGTYRVTVLGGVSGGITGGTPTPYAEGHVNEHGVNVGGEAGGSAGSVLNVGVEYQFGSQEEVDEFIAWQNRQMQVGVGIHQFETYEPPAPSATIVEGGAYATGSGGAAVVPLAGGRGEVSVEGLVGTRVDQSNGLTTVYVRGEAAGGLEGTGLVPGTGDLGGPGVYAVTYDAAGNVVPNPPSSLITTPQGGTTETHVDVGGSAGTPLPVVGGAGGGVNVRHERTEYPGDGA